MPLKRQLFKCSLTVKQINKLWYIYAVEYYKVIKKNDLLIYKAKEMTLVDTTLQKSNPETKRYILNYPSNLSKKNSNYL